MITLDANAIKCVYEEKLNQMLESVKKYIDDNTQEPSTTDKDTNVKKMGTWIGTQQTKWESFITTCKEYFPNNIVIKIESSNEKYVLQNIRLEKSILRYYLKHNKEHRCIICKEEFPFIYLAMTYLKPRSICKDDELIDINIVQLMCLMCHKAYKLGDIGINNGKVEVHDGVNWVHTKTIECYNDDTKKYFNYHFKNITIKK